jgi:hypothetical protein
MHFSLRHIRAGAVTSAALLAIVAQAQTALAQAIGPTYSIGAAAGLVVPIGDLSNLTSSGYTVSATLGMHQPLMPLGFRVEGSYSELPWEGSNDIKHRIYGFSIDGLFNLGTPSTNGGLYVTGGLGYFGWKDTDIFDNGTTWDLGLNAGLGYYLPLSGFTVSFEGRYRSIFSSTNQAMFPITVGITF